MKLNFNSWKIGLVFGTFVYNNGKGLGNMSGSKHSVASFISSLLGYIFTKYYNIIKEVDINSC